MEAQSCLFLRTQEASMLKLTFFDTNVFFPVFFARSSFGLSETPKGWSGNPCEKCETCKKNQQPFGFSMSVAPSVRKQLSKKAKLPHRSLEKYLVACKTPFPLKEERYLASSLSLACFPPPAPRTLSHALVLRAARLPPRGRAQLWPCDALAPLSVFVAAFSCETSLPLSLSLPLHPVSLLLPTICFTVAPKAFPASTMRRPC